MQKDQGLELCREVLFKLKYPTGELVTIHTDGTVTGVPSGTETLNRYPTILHSLVARLDDQRL